MRQFITKTLRKEKTLSTNEIHKTQTKKKDSVKITSIQENSIPAAS